ncbi:MAG: ParB/RepB/Spo0J family partition protein [Verrucomicrobiota bacterium]
MVKQVLGRGLGALLSGHATAGKPAAANPIGATVPPAPESAHAAAPLPSPPAPVDARERILTVPMDRIRACPLQPRKDFTAEAIKELADSIREQGIINPLVVRQKGEVYELIAGERRWRASQSLGLASVPVIVREADDVTVLELSLIENLQRENLNAIEEAHGYAQLISQFQLTQEEAAIKVGKSRAMVANAVRLLRLPAEIQTWIREGRLSVGHAKVILGLNTDEEQYLAAERALRDGLSVRQLEEMVALWQNPAAVPKPGKVKSSGVRDLHVVALESRMQERFGTKVTLRYRQGKGSLEIRFYSDDELERILGIAGIKPE